MGGVALALWLLRHSRKLPNRSLALMASEVRGVLVARFVGLGTSFPV